jgi:hypothetical protein
MHAKTWTQDTETEKLVNTVVPQASASVIQIDFDWIICYTRKLSPCDFKKSFPEGVSNSH